MSPRPSHAADPVSRAAVAGVRPGHHSPTVPAALRPRWRDLPALGYVLGRAFGTPLTRVRLVGTVWVTPAVLLFWLPLLAWHQLGRQVAAVDRRAVLVLDGPQHIRLRALLGFGLAYFAGLLAATTALTVALVLLAVPARADLLLLPALAEIVALAVRALHRGDPDLRPDLRRLGAHGPIWRVSYFAAWPRTVTTAWPLVRALRATPELSSVTLLAYAASDQLAASYRRLFAMTPLPHNEDPRLLWRPATHHQEAQG